MPVVLGAREITTVFYFPAPTGHTVTVTKTEIQTTAAPLLTVTYGTPWTTASPRHYTQYKGIWVDGHLVPTAQVNEYYPAQPRYPEHANLNISCPNPTRKIVSGVFGGLGIGLLMMQIVCFIMMLVMLRRKKQRRAQSELGSIHLVDQL